MPIVDKQVYLAMLREKLDAYVSANTVRQIIADASETLSGFDVITLAPTSCEYCGRKFRDADLKQFTINGR